jgi:hypothetical protein
MSINSATPLWKKLGYKRYFTVGRKRPADSRSTSGNNLRAKLRRRAPLVIGRFKGVTIPDAHPLFRIVPGGVRDWEKDDRETQTLLANMERWIKHRSACKMRAVAEHDSLVLPSRKRASIQKYRPIESGVVPR